MPRFNANLNITTGRGDTLSASKSGNYNEVFNLSQKVDNTNTSILMLTGASGKGSATLSHSNSFIIKNNGLVGAEITISSLTHTDATPDTTGANAFQKYLLGANDFIYLPNMRQMYSASINSSSNAYSLSKVTPHANMYRALDNVAAGDPQLIAEAVDSGAETAIDVDEGAYFYIGDLIRLEDEVMEVTGISSNTLTVIRGTHGTTKATHADDVAIRLPFFNNLVDFDKYSTVQTDANGQFKATNFFGFARNTDGSSNRESMGLVAGSFSAMFYSSGYQELGLAGITSSTNSGLAVSTAYQFNITADGGSAFALSFTTDSSDVTFGGTNGIIAKIQDALDTAFYTAGNLFEKKITISIIKGDIRFTSSQRLSTSAILLADSSGSDTDIWGVGRFPAVANVEAAVASKLPPDEIIDSKSGLAIQNISQMAYDNGFGNINGICNGTINYETGAIQFTNAPPNANFVISVNYGSSQSGGNRFSNNDGNCITAIAGRSCNQYIDTTIEVIGLQ